MPSSRPKLAAKSASQGEKCNEIYRTSAFDGFDGVGRLCQRPRAVDPSTATPKVAPAPKTFKAKYEGGVFGYNKKQTGTLSFDDVIIASSSAIVPEEILFIPFDAVSQAFADTQARRPAAATVVSHIPVPYGLNIPAAFIKKKYQYLTLQFYDPNSHVGGVTSFKLANKALVNSVVDTLAEKAGLERRGEVFVRTRPSGTDMGSADPPYMPPVSVENEALIGRSLPRPVYPTEVDKELTGTYVCSLLLTSKGRSRGWPISGQPCCSGRR